MSSDTPVISLEGVTKGFRVEDADRPSRWHGLRRGRADRFIAVDDVSLRLNPGEVVGLVGANGAGKSTLLKLISRVMHPDAGRITIEGPIMSLLEVGAGFHPELTARENVFLNGAILGLSPKDVKRSFDDIVQLAHVEKFLETPVKRLSSGMRVRLAIAVGLHLECDAVILDEVLSVGDAAFQQRALSILDHMVAEQGRAALLVSHSMQTIRQACSRVVVLEHGRVAFDGDPETAIGVYVDEVSGQRDRPSSVSLTSRTNPYGSNILHLESLRLVDRDGEPLSVLTTGPLGLEADLNVAGIPDGSVLTIRFSTRSSPLIAAIDLTIDSAQSTTASLRWYSESCPFSAGHYSMSAALHAPDGSPLDVAEDALSFVVIDPTADAGSLRSGLSAGFVQLAGVVRSLPARLHNGSRSAG